MQNPPLPLRRALVLGGGAALGNAWLIGVLAGLQDAGLDVTDADPIVGTSAGATAAIQITNAPLPALIEAVLDGVVPQRPPGGGRPPAGGLLERTQEVIDASADPADMRRRMGALFLELGDDEGTERWRRIVAARLPGAGWPDRRVLLTAVEASTGDPVVLEPSSGVDVVDAVAASTAGGAAYRIGDRWYLDGGYRRNENADLAAGCARVLVLSPFGGRTRHPLAWRMQLDAQVEDLRAGGSRVEVVGPDAASQEAFGPVMTDLGRRPLAGRAGFEQGRSIAASLAAFWAV